MSTTAKKVVAALAAAVMAAAVSVTGATSSEARPSWDSTPVEVTHQVTKQAKLVDLRVAEHGRFDRVVIDLKGEIPGYLARYTKKLAYDPSGLDVPLPGRRFAFISLIGATAHTRAGDSTYDGPRLKRYHFETFRGVALTSDWEGVVTLGFSVRKRADFRVIELADPSRIAIDFRH